ncbi:MAG: DEAD/DEAH box helicase [Lentisphaeria bacterium]|nr:DEAD/DEAH box helicase [Lentisphaeria bacterium]NQZ69693.1 DEAD/DEAH box helicase [Lentisphaeria bacterium]
MSLNTKYAPLFPDEIKVQATAIIDAQAIYLSRVSDSSVAAEINFQNDYIEIELSIEDKELVVNCSCDDALSGALCQHVFATLLIADRDEELQKVNSRSIKKTVRNKHSKSKAVEEVRPEQKQSLDLKYYMNQFKRENKISLNTIESSETVTKANQQWRIIYIIEERRSQSCGTLVISHYWQKKRDGQWLAEKEFVYQTGQDYPDKIDQSVIQFLASNSRSSGNTEHCRELKAEDHQQVLSEILKTGRLYKRTANDLISMQMEMKNTTLQFQFEKGDSGDYKLDHHLHSKNESFDLNAEQLFLNSPVLIHQDCIIALTRDQMVWLQKTARHSASYSHREVETLSREIHLNTAINCENFPAALRFEVSETEVRGQLYIRTAQFRFRDKEQLHVELSFNYAGSIVEENSKIQRLITSETRQLITRNAKAEGDLKDKLMDLDFRFVESSLREEEGWKLLPAKLDHAVKILIDADWEISAEGKTYRKPQEIEMKLSYKMDWFELEGTAQFDDQELPLTELISAAKEGNGFVTLDDGSIGVLPLEWLTTYTVLTEIGICNDEMLKFSRGQFYIVDQLLRDEKIKRDSSYLEAAEKFQNFEKIHPLEAADDFNGTLRDYQKDGLGWMTQMSELGLGMCLADDMGLGKTVQVLALLNNRQNCKNPSLIVLPKSLIFNWAAEAEAFCPHLSVLNYTGASRVAQFKQIAKHRIVLTTYGTLRQDILKLKDIQFDYCILDESQAIKNIKSQNSKAARLITANHRLAMTGTPIENRLTELLSQFEFINPGMIGNLSVFKQFFQDKALNDEQILSFQKAVKPFFLRRTKKEVAKDLPEKTVQVLHCDLSQYEQERYDELKAYYQKELLDDDAKKSPNLVLQALMRLRQAACHSALINPKFNHEISAKQKLITHKMSELIAEGHKLLIFSQFTSFLSLMQKDCEKQDIAFSYLDGKTKNRDEQVQRFQNDDNVKVFLISLKAGGVGLNLTAADYVFLMDPWWNPAIEAQAIDRAYRIGQKKNVFAYKVISRGTIEEKVIQLQKKKQELADSIFAAEGNMINDLSKEDLQFLLS